MRVLHEGSEHCCSCVSKVGLEGPWYVEADEPRACCARARAHAPAFVHECAVSDRWSRQYLLGKRC